MVCDLRSRAASLRTCRGLGGSAIVADGRALVVGVVLLRYCVIIEDEACVNSRRELRSSFDRPCEDGIVTRVGAFCWSVEETK